MRDVLAFNEHLEDLIEREENIVKKAVGEVAEEIL